MRGPLRSRLGATRIGICMPVLGELWFGVERSASRDRNVQLLKRVLASWTVWPFDEEAAEEYGRLSALLRAAGRPIQQIDIMIRRHRPDARQDDGRQLR